MTTTIPPLPAGELPERPRGAATWYDVLDVARDADVATIQAAYDHAIGLIEGRSLGGYFMLDPAAAAVARQDVEAAWTILSDEDRRSAYDRSLVGDDTDLPSSPSRPRPTNLPVSLTPRPSLRFLAPVDATPAIGTPIVQVPPSTPPPSTTPPRLPTPPAHRVAGIPFAPPADATPPSTPTLPDTVGLAETTPPVTLPPVTLPPMDATLPPLTLPPTAPRRVEVPLTSTPTPPPGLFSLDGEVNGQTLRRLREARRLSLDELAEATKIRRPYLAAIEEQDFENLPSRVYLRGFLTQIARVLRVDKVRLADGYLAFIARFGK